MKFSELPPEIQEKLNKEILARRRHVNNSYTIYIHNESGTRYFSAHRRQFPWSDNKGNYLPFGGGSRWEIRYGVVQWHRTRDPFGGVDYEWFDGKMYRTSANGTPIPSTLPTKKDAIELIKRIGIFSI